MKTVAGVVGKVSKEPEADRAWRRIAIRSNSYRASP